MIDVVVVGQGIAGLCAAFEAHRAGAEVLVLERVGGGGGASALSEGIFYLGGGTPVQQACGYEYTPQNLYNFLRASTSHPDDAVVRTFREGAREHFDWLEQQGVPFTRNAYPGKVVSLRTADCLLATGNEKVWPFKDAAQPVPRGHLARSDEVNGGLSAMRALLATCEAEGIAVIYNWGRVISMTAPLIKAPLAEAVGLAPVMSLASVSFLLAALIWFILPETAGRSVDDRKAPA